MSSRGDRDDEEAGGADLAMVRAALEGDPAAGERLARRLACIPRMLASVNRRSGQALSSHDLEDLAQETALLIWRKLGGFQGEGSLERWAYRFCFLEFMNQLRAANRVRKVAPGVDAGDVDVAAEAAPRHRLDFLARLEAGLSDLGPPDEEVIRLKHFEDRTFVEIGQALDMSPNTVKARYYRALERIRRRLAALREEVVS